MATLLTIVSIGCVPIEAAGGHGALTPPLRIIAKY